MSKRRQWPVLAAFAVALLIATISASPASADVTALAPVAVSGTASQPFAGDVATFFSGTSGPYTVSVDWGDGSPVSSGSVTGGPKSYTARGAHTYAHEGSYKVTVTVLDSSDDSSQTTTATASIADAPLSLTGRPISATAGQAFDGAVGHLTDADTSGATGAYTASVDWGDGSSAPASLSPASGGYDVLGSHTYAQAGSFTVTVTANDAGGATASATTTATVTAATTVTTPPNTQPIAKIAVAGGEPRATPATMLDASGSSPGSGAHIIAYMWDFNNDGHIDANTGTSPYATIVSAGNRTVGVSVEDSAGRLTHTTAPLGPLGPAPAGCQTQVQVGIFHVTAGCIRLTDGVYHVSPARDLGTTAFDVNVDGVDLRTFNPRNQLTFDTHARQLTGTGDWRIDWLNPPDGRPINLWDSGASGFQWTVGSRDGSVTQIASLGLSSHCNQNDEHTTCLKLPGDFPMEGEAGLSIDTSTYAAILHVQVTLQNPFPVAVTGGVDLRFDPLTADIRIDSLTFGVSDAELGPVHIQPLVFHYEAPGTGTPMHDGSLWSVAVGLDLMSGRIHVGGNLVFVNGRFCYGGGDYMQDPGIPIYAGVFMNHFGGHFQYDCGRGSGNFGLGVLIGASFAQELQLDVNGDYERHSDGIFALSLHGTLKLNDTPLAHAYTEYWSDGYFAWGGGVDYGYPADDPVVHLSVTLGAWVEDEGPADVPFDHRRFLWQADLSGSLSLSIFTVSGAGFLNQRYVAGCGTVSVVITFNGCGYYDFASRDGHVLGSDTHSIDPYRAIPTHDHSHLPGTPGTSAVTAAAVTAKTFSIAAGKPLVNIEADGATAAPDVTLTDPHGRVIALPAGQAAVRDGSDIVVKLAKYNETVFILRRPAAGQWTLTPRAGSSPIVKVMGAEELPALHIHARVTGTGHQRRLTWQAPQLAGRAIRFVERGRNVGHTILTTRSPRGSSPFTIQDGSAGLRTVQALVTDHGAPSPAVVTTRFRAPGPEHPGRPKSGKVTRRRSRAVIRWAKVSGADGYLVIVDGSDGRRERHYVTRPRLTAAHLFPSMKLRIQVRAWEGSEDITGPALRLHLAAVTGTRKNR